ncbi:MAG TPA: ABC transporter permease [Acidimicrobiales bacterium]|nr:ABC transporter permease [Acidimicrobiales bacterium]
MRALLAFLRFEVGRLIRSWKFLAITVGFPVVFYALFLHDRSPARVVDHTVPWRVYLMVSMGSFAALVAGLNAGGSRLSAERASGWARQLRVTPLPGWSLVATKVAASMLVILPVLVPVEIVGAAFGGVHLALATWIELTALLWVAALPLAILGVLVGFLVHQETAYPVVTALMFVLGYFGGLFNPVSTMSSPLQSAARALPSFHHDSLGLALVDGRGFGVQDALVLGAYSVALGLAVMAKHKLDEARGLA